MALYASLAAVESHLQQQQLPSSDRVMTSPLQATTPDASAAVPSQTRTSYDPQFVQTQGMQPAQNRVSCITPDSLQIHSSSGLLVAQDPTIHAVLPMQTQAAYFVQAVPVPGSYTGQPVQMPASAGPVPTQFQADYGEQFMQMEVSYMYLCTVSRVSTPY